jgi:RNA polymerase sigma-70 factor (ECF subfamily)
MDEREAQETEAAGTCASPPIPGRAVEALLAAQDAVFSEFYRNFVPTLVGFLLWQGVPLREAADIAQETMILAYRRWNTIHTPQAWARRVASQMWARRIASTVEDLFPDVPEQRSPLLAIGDAEAWEQRHDILRLLSQLPPRQRQVLAWSMDGYTPAEIAEELKMTPEAVRSSLFKARRTLATDLRVNGRH